MKKLKNKDNIVDGKVSYVKQETPKRTRKESTIEANRKHLKNRS